MLLINWPTTRVLFQFHPRADTIPILQKLDHNLTTAIAIVDDIVIVIAVMITVIPPGPPMLQLRKLQLGLHEKLHSL